MSVDKSGAQRLVEEHKKQLAALKEEEQKLGDRIREQAKVVFSSASKIIFEQHPKLVAFGWAQYTPYFNDGEECVFSARTGDPEIQFGDEEELEECYIRDYEYVADGEEQYRDWAGRLQTRAKTKRVPKALTETEIAKKAAFEAVKDFLSNFDDDILKGMFGDHQKITVTAEGVDTDSYDHE